MQLVLVALAALLAIYVYFQKSFQYWRERGVLSPDPKFPFGNVFGVIFRYQSVNDKVCEIYAAMKRRGCKYAGMYFFSRKVFVPIDPMVIKCILSKDFQYFNDRGIYYDEDNDPVSAHLFSLSGTKWKKLRSKLTPAFTAGKVKYMYETILRTGNEMTELVSRRLELDGTVEIRDVLARFTTDVIGLCAFGIECNSLRDPEAEFRMMGRRAFTQTKLDAFKMIIIRSLPNVAKVFKLGVFAPEVSEFFKRIVEDAINFRRTNEISRKDFLQLLIQMMDDSDESPLTMNEAAAQAFIFFLAGFETTSATIGFALLEMSLNIDIQSKARVEVEYVLRKYNGELNYEAISDLRYLDMIVSESLRKYPPAPVFLRKCTKRYQVPDSAVIIEEGQSVLIPAMALHRDEEFFKDPELFDPSRFSEDNKCNIKDYTYLPFGDGPRICIGMRFAMVQSKLALAALLKNFSFTLSRKTKVPIKMETKGIVLAPIGGIWLTFKNIQ